MCILLISSLCLISSAGCTSTRLANRTVDQASTLSDIQYQQVLDNLAMFCTNPDALPWQIRLRDGSAQIADLGSAQILLDWRRAITSHPSLLGSRTVVEQWGMSPVTDDTELQLLRIAYRRAIGRDESLEDDDKEFANDLAHELAKQSPDLDDFRGDIAKYYEELKNKKRNLESEKLSTGTTPLPLLSYFLGLPNFSLNRANSGALRGILFPTGVYSDFAATTLSIGDESVILDGETIVDLDVWANYDEIDPVSGTQYRRNPAKYNQKRLDYINNYNNKNEKLNEVKEDFREDSQPRLITRYGTRVNCVTPDAAEARRQVKDIQRDLIAIDPNRRWFGHGSRRDIPKDACYVGRYRDCYVWVCPDGRADLTKFTIKILKFSSVIKDDGVLTIPGPRFTPASGFPSL